MHPLTSRPIFSLLFFVLVAVSTALAQHHHHHQQRHYPTTSAEELRAILYPPPPPATGDHKTPQLSQRGRSRAKGIYVCNREDYQGACWWAGAKGNECQNWDDVRSMGPDNGLACDLFEGEDCRGKMAVRFVTWPGIKKTPKAGLKSWRCGSH